LIKSTCFIAPITCRGAKNANQQNYDENDRRLSHDVRPSWFVMQKMGKNKERRLWHCSLTDATSAAALIDQLIVVIDDWRTYV